MSMQRKLLFLTPLLTFILFGLVFNSSAQTTYEADLSGINVVQPVVSNGTGSVTLTLSGDTLTLSGSFSALTSAYRMSHIHMASAGLNGNVVFTLKTTLSTDSLSGSYAGADNRFVLTTDQKNDLQSGNFYVQIHTANNPDGELRGQILGSPDTAPSGATVTFPPDGFSATVEGDGTTELTSTFSKSTDPEGNKVVYIWQLSALPDFSSLLVNINTDTLTSAKADFATVDQILQQLNLAVGSTVTLYHRLITSDGSKTTVSSGQSLTVTRGIVNYTIAQARSAFSGAQVNIKGIVTRTYGAYTRMQDTTGGITIRQTSGAFYDAVQNGNVWMGDSLSITGKTSDLNFLKVIDQGDLDTYTVLSRYNKLPDPKRITLNEISVNGEAYESELIRVQGLKKFQTTGTFQAATNYMISDNSNNSGNVTLQTPAASDGTIDGASIPDTMIVFAGVLSQSSTTSDTAGYQLQPVLDTDLYASAFAQIIHNAADPAADSVDIYINGIRKVHKLKFRKATKYLEIPSNRDLVVGVAPGNSTSVNDTLKSFKYNLTEAQNYVLTASGVLDPTKFAVNPDGVSTAFNIIVRDSARQEAVDQNKFEFFAVHGVTDAPTVDVTVTGGVLLVNDFKYSDVTSYGSVDPIQYVINLTDKNDNTSIIKSFDVDLTNMAGKTAVILASGFVDPSANQNGADLRLLVVFADGSTAIPAIDTGIEDEQVTTIPQKFRLQGNYPNPFNPTTTIKFDLPQAAEVNLSVYDVLGRKVMSMDIGKIAAGVGKTVQLNASNLASGMYIYRLTARAAGKVMVQNGRMTLLK